MTALHRPLSPTGHPAGLIVNEQIVRIERAVGVLDPLDLTLDEIERLARALKKAWVANLLRLDRHREVGDE